MDNWDTDDTDSMVANLGYVADAEGSLQEQADIYEEGWEAASKRVSAALESVYQGLLNDDGFITLLNIFEKIVVAIDKIVDSLGGLNGVLPLIAVGISKLFGKDIATNFDNLLYNIKTFTKKGKEELIELKKSALDIASDMYNGDSDSGAAMADMNKSRLELQKQLVAKTTELEMANRGLSEEEQKQAALLLDINKSLGEQYVKLVKNSEKLNEETSSLEKKAQSTSLGLGEENLKNFNTKVARTEDVNVKTSKGTVKATKTRYDSYSGSEGFSNLLKEAKQSATIFAQNTKAFSTFNKAFKKVEKSVDTTSKSYKSFTDQIEHFIKAANDSSIELDQGLLKKVEEMNKIANDTNLDDDAKMTQIREIINSFDSVALKAEASTTQLFDAIRSGAQAAGADMEKFDPVLQSIRDSYEKTGALTVEQINTLASYGVQVDATGKIISEFKGKIATVGDSLASVTTAATTLKFALSQADAFGEQFFDPDTTGLERLILTVNLASSALGAYKAVQEAVATVDSTIAGLKAKKAAATAKDTAATVANTGATAASVPAIKGASQATDKNTEAVNKNKVAIMSHPVIGVLVGVLMAVAAAISFVTASIEKENEEAAENAQISKEKADAAYEEIKANNELVKSFNETLEAYKEGTASKEEMIEVSESVVAAYDVENSYLLTQAGRYDELAAAIRRAQQEKLQLAENETRIARDDAAAVFEDTMRDGRGRFTGPLNAFGEEEKYQVIFSDDSDEVNQAFANLQKDSNSHINSNIFGNSLTTKNTSTDELIGIYEDIQAVVQEAQRLALANDSYDALQASDSYQQMLEYLKKSEESYNNLIALQSQLNDLNAQSEIIDIKNSLTDEISTLTEYEDIKAQLAESFQETDSKLSADKAEELAQAALEVDEYFSDIAQKAKLLSQIKVEMNLNDSEFNELQELYDGLSDGEKELFATLSFKKDAGIDSLEEQLNFLQSKADLRSVQVKLEAVKTGISNLKDNMSAEDYAAYETSSSIDWGNEEDNIIKYSDFLALTYEQQLEYLTNLKIAYTKQVNLATEGLLDETQQELDSKQNWLKIKLLELQDLAQYSFTGLYGEDKNYKTSSEITDAITELSGYDKNSTEYSDQLKELHNAGISDEAIQSYLDAIGAVERYQTDVSSLTQTLNELKGSSDDSEIEKIIKIKTELEDADSINELQNKWANILQEAGEDEEVSFTLYANALKDLGAEYDNCSQELNAFTEALKFGTEEQIAATQSALELAIRVEELADEFDLEANEIKDVAKAFKEMAQADKETYGILLEDNEALADAATRYIRVNNAVLDLSKSYNNYLDVIKDLKNAETALEKAQIVNTSNAVKLRKSLADLIGTSEELVDVDLLSTIDPDLFEAAALGDVTAIEKIRNAFMELQTAATGINFDELKAEIDSLQEGVVIDISGNTTPFLYELIQAKVNAGATAAEIENLLSGFGIDADIEPFLGTMDELAAASEIAGQEVIRNTSFQQEVQPEEIEQENTTEEVEYETTLIPHLVPVTSQVLKNGFDKPTPVVEQRYEIKKVVTPKVVSQTSTSTSGAVAVNTTNAAGDSGNITGVLIKNAHKTHYSSSTPSSSTMSTAASNVSSATSSGSGGSSGSSSSSTPKTAEKKKESDVLDRYKEITDALDDVTRATNKATKAADRLYGKSRIDAMKQANASLQKEIELLKQKKTETEKYLQIDKDTLDAAASAAGVSFTYDDEGNITNYTEQMRSLLERYNELVEEVNADGDVSDEEQELLDTLQDLIDALKDAISQYDDTKESLQDLDEQITDKFYEWQDNNYEILHYELEIELELNDLQLEYIDYYLNKIEDDFYSMAEAAEVLMGKIDPLTNSLSSYESFYGDLNQAYANGEISQADYVEGLKECYSGILDTLQALNELDKKMMHYYEDTLKAAAEELDKYTDRMEHLTSVLGHYKNLIELINGEYDYDSIGKLLEAQAHTLKNELDVATANYKMLLSEKEAIEASLASAQDDAARELFQAELDAINAAIDEAHEEVLSKTEEWAEAQKAIMENAMAEAAWEMEKAFTDGMGFDALSDSLSRLSSYADEYLTKTNQMYETQKLINTAQQAADKSTNEAAKARLKAYTDEVKELQEKNKLSNLELEIAKAKYEVVLAEIALEEAQNAKSTVRLQRDSEGNFGYVYTSDQDQISQAEQDLADAQNALYNIGLNGANEYGQKLLELQQQLAEQLIALEQARADGQFATDEEYYAARDQLIQEYNDLFLAYSEQYTTALGVDVSIQEEAWVNAYENMINKTGDWQEKTQMYTEKCEEAYESWRDVVETESEVIDAILNDLESEIDDVTEASDDLKNEVTGKVIPAINNELSAVRQVTSAYASERAAIQQLITYYEQLAQAIYQVIAAQAAMSGASASSGSSSSVDYDQDFSRLMAEAWAAGDMELYEYYKRLREEKINAGYSDWGVSTDEIDDYLHDNEDFEMDDDDWWPDILKKGGFATGGYTGSWGPEGKIALLHEKELVLNADDTENFLKGIDVIRSISDSIDLKAMREKVSTLPFYPGNEIQRVTDTIEQTVHIEASFPNVQDRNEIQEAFNTLINKASQYANRR